MNFVKAVREKKVAGPTGRGFDLQKWGMAAETAESITEKDLALFVAGAWTFQRLEAIREYLTRTDGQLPSPNTVFRLLTGMLNREAKVLAGKRDQAVLRVARLAGAVRDSEILQLRESDLLGNATDYDIAITAILDGARFAFSHALELEEKGLGAAEETAFAACRRLLFCGQLYDQTHGIWGECLWNDWQVNEGNPIDVITPSAESPHYVMTITHYRWQALRYQMLMMAGNLWKFFPDDVRDRYLAMSPVAVRLQSANTTTPEYSLRGTMRKEVPSRALVKVALLEEYYSIFMDLPFKRPGTITLRQTLDAWSVLQAIAELQQSESPYDYEAADTDNAGRFICTVRRTEIVDHIAVWLKVEASTAEALVDFFTYNGKPREELWTAPLVKVSDTELAMVHAPLLFGSLTYFLERCLRRGEVNVTEKGTLYEEYLRSLLISSFRSSKILRRTGVYPGRFDIGSDGIGDVDLVFWIGDTVLMGESKCMIFPIEPHEVHNHFGTLKEASAQIDRKVAYYRTRPHDVVQHLGQDSGLSVERLRILPFVITNQAIGAGYAIDGIPVIDFPILERFIVDGIMLRFAVHDDSADTFAGVKRTIYTTEVEAEQVVWSYLLNPPQVSSFARFLVPTVRTITGLSESVHYATMATLDVNIPSSAWPNESLQFTQPEE